MRTKKQNIIVLIVLVVVAVFFFSGVVRVLAQEYVSLSPLPGVENVDTSNPSEYFGNILKVMVGVAGILAVIVVMFYGLQYMLSNSEGGKTAARIGISSVVFGIFIILLSYVVLSVINPDLVKLRFFDKLKEVAKDLVKGEPEEDSTPDEKTHKFTWTDNTLKGGCDEEKANDTECITDVGPSPGPSFICCTLPK